jgi:hypothetical protein
VQNENQYCSKRREKYRRYCHEGSCAIFTILPKAKIFSIGEEYDIVPA